MCSSDLEAFNRRPPRAWSSSNRSSSLPSAPSCNHSDPCNPRNPWSKRLGAFGLASPSAAGWLPQMSGSPDTICALATPVGTAALALVRVSGPEARRIAVELAGGAAPLPRQVRHGDYRDQAGVVLDEAVFTFFAAPRSYSGEDTLEISGHGNPYVEIGRAHV